MFTRCDCGQAMKLVDRAEYGKCYKCNHKGKKRSSSYDNNQVIKPTGKWTKYNGSWCIIMKSECNKGDRVRVYKRDGSHEVHALGNYLGSNPWGAIYAIGS